MPVHDWSRIEAGIFHDFHHSIVHQVARELNGGLLEPDYYAIVEPFALGTSPDATTPDAPDAAETEMDAYRRKKSLVAVRHVSGDRVVALVEVVSPGNKSSRHALDSFVQKVAEFLDRRIHLLIIDLIRPGRYDPSGIHGAIWEYIDGRPYEPPAGKPLTVAAYESSTVTRAYVEPIAVGDELPEMPLFLEPDGCVEVPLEISYRSAWEAVPRRWRAVLESSQPGMKPEE